MERSAKWVSRVLAVCVAILAMEGGNCRADTAMGLVDFRQGQFAEAFEEWQAAAATGDVRASLYLGVMYDTGLGVPRDLREALGWYTKAAERGSAAAAFNIGVMYDSGIGVEANLRLAADWYGRAAAQGFGRAEYNLAMLYEGGLGVAANRSHAILLYSRAAAHGISAAKIHLAVLHVHTPPLQHVQRDTASEDFQQAQQLLLSRGAAEVSHIADLFRRAAEQRNPLAEYDLGYCYEHGMGVHLDLAEAYSWYRRAAAHATDTTLKSMATESVNSLAGHLTEAQKREGDVMR